MMTDDDRRRQTTTEDDRQQQTTTDHDRPRQTGPRQMKDTLKTKVGDLVEPHLVNGTIPAGAYKPTIDKINTQVVQEAKRNCVVNRVLGTPAPKIDATESSLSLDQRALCCRS